MGRLMGLDLGEKRIGVAVTDVQQTMAFPERVLERRSAKADRQALAALVGELEIDRVIIGLPLSMEGEFGPNAERARSFGQYLARALRVPVDYQDERLTTVEAEERLRASGLSPAERRQRIDAAAAAIILEDYMRDHAK
ncbi:MAG TPA: Holliday junction resolvase RuvX [Chloroflexota bacterium]|nr:Holliday junction resolvase RuvX [Chloroflexota bacterium]